MVRARIGPGIEQTALMDEPARSAQRAGRERYFQAVQLIRHHHMSGETRVRPPVRQIGKLVDFLGDLANGNPRLQLRTS